MYGSTSCAFPGIGTHNIQMSLLILYIYYDCLHYGSLLDLDGTSVVGPRSCGGTIRLSNSMPDFTLNSPYYYQPSSTAYVLCYWHVHAPSGQEVELTWLDIDNRNQYVYLYDYPASTSYQISSIKGDIDVDISPVVSSRGGWTVQHTDSYSGNNGKGFLAEFSLRGKVGGSKYIKAFAFPSCTLFIILFTIIDSSSNMSKRKCIDYFFCRRPSPYRPPFQRKCIIEYFSRRFFFFFFFLGGGGGLKD